MACMTPLNRSSPVMTSSTSVLNRSIVSFKLFIPSTVEFMRKFPITCFHSQACSLIPSSNGLKFILEITHKSSRNLQNCDLRTLPDTRHIIVIGHLVQFLDDRVVEAKFLVVLLKRCIGRGKLPGYQRLVQRPEIAVLLPLEQITIAVDGQLVRRVVHAQYQIVYDLKAD